VTRRPSAPGRLGLGDTVELTVRTLRTHWRPLLVLYALIDVPLYLLGTAAGSGFAAELERAAASGASGTPAPPIGSAAISPDELAALLPLLAQVVAISVLSGIVATIATAAIALAMRDASEGRRPGVGASLAGALRRSPALLVGTALAQAAVVLVVVVVAGLLVVLGMASGEQPLTAGGGPSTFLALIAVVAGVVVVVALQTRWTFVAQAVVLDRAGALDGLRLSWAVTRGSTWRVFLTLAVIALALVVLASLVQESVALVVGAAGGAAVAGGVIVTAVGALMSVVLGVMLPIATTIVYLDLRARRAATAGGQPATAGVRD
jgi:hypothetical protein